MSGQATRSERDTGAHVEALRNLLFVVLAIGAAYTITTTIGIDRLRELVRSAGIFGPIAVVLLKMSTIIVVPLGGGPIYAVAGALFGFWNGLLLTLIGDVLGFSVAFYISRLWGRSIIQFFVPRAQVASLETMLDRGSELRPFIKARMAFAALPEVFAYVAGLSKVSFFIFLPVQVLPHIPTMVLLVFFGDALLAGDSVYVVATTALAVMLMLVGGWWFHRDVAREA